MRDADGQPAARIPMDEPRLLQHANAFANRRAVDAELPHQLGFRAERLAGTQPPAGDLSLDGFGDQLIGRRRVDAFESFRGIRHRTALTRFSAPSLARSVPVAKVAFLLRPLMATNQIYRI